MAVDKEDLEGLLEKLDRSARQLTSMDEHTAAAVTLAGASISLVLMGVMDRLERLVELLEDRQIGHGE